MIKACKNWYQVKRYVESHRQIHALRFMAECMLTLSEMEKCLKRCLNEGIVVPSDQEDMYDVVPVDDRVTLEARAEQRVVAVLEQMTEDEVEYMKRNSSGCTLTAFNYVLAHDNSLERFAKHLESIGLIEKEADHYRLTFAEPEYLRWWKLLSSYPKKKSVEETPSALRRLRSSLMISEQMKRKLAETMNEEAVDAEDQDDEYDQDDADDDEDTDNDGEEDVDAEFQAFLDDLCAGIDLYDEDEDNADGDVATDEDNEDEDKTTEEDPARTNPFSVEDVADGFIAAYLIDPAGDLGADELKERADEREDVLAKMQKDAQAINAQRIGEALVDMMASMDGDEIGDLVAAVEEPSDAQDTEESDVENSDESSDESNEEGGQTLAQYRAVNHWHEMLRFRLYSVLHTTAEDGAMRDYLRSSQHCYSLERQLIVDADARIVSGSSGPALSAAKVLLNRRRRDESVFVDILLGKLAEVRQEYAERQEPEQEDFDKEAWEEGQALFAPLYALEMGVLLAENLGVTREGLVNVVERHLEVLEDNPIWRCRKYLLTLILDDLNAANNRIFSIMRRYFIG